MGANARKAKRSETGRRPGSAPRNFIQRSTNCRHTSVHQRFSDNASPLLSSCTIWLRRKPIGESTFHRK